MVKKQKKLKVSIENLHAKCYVNEEHALLSSMNLYEYSQINNHELSVLFSAKEDRDEYLKLNMKVSKILRSKIEKLDMAYLALYGNFKMRDLYIELTSQFNFPVKSKEPDSVYRFLCDEARKIMNFSKDELYEDGSAILRNMLLGKKSLIYYTMN